MSVITNNLFNKSSYGFTVGTGNITVTTGNISASAAINADVVSATTTVTGGTGVTATTGDAIVSNGYFGLAITGFLKINSFNALYTSDTSTTNIFVGDSVDPAQPETVTLNNVAVGKGCFVTLGDGASVAGESCYNTGFGYNSAADPLKHKEITSFGASCATSMGDRGLYLGYKAGYSSGTGVNVIMLGAVTGDGLSGTDNENIFIGYNNPGINDNLYTLRIGSATGTGAGEINVAIICGITGKTSTSGAALLINASNVLGTTTSNLDSKQDIADMGDDSDVIYDLLPKTFKFINDTDPKPKQYGLIAEDVAVVFDGMVLYDKDNKPWNLSYHFLPPMLVNEFKKLEARIRNLEGV